MRRAALGIAALFAAGPLVVVHGGGRAIDADLRARGKSPRVRRRPARHRRGHARHRCRRCSPARINTTFVAALGAAGVRAVGLTGADAALGRSTQAPALHVGDRIERRSRPGRHSRAPRRRATLLDRPAVARLCPGDRQHRRRRRWRAAERERRRARRAPRASRSGATRLIVAGIDAGVFDGAGVTCASARRSGVREAMVAAGTARDGMVAKLRACLDALAGGVADVRIVDGRDGAYSRQRPGTTDYAAHRGAPRDDSMTTTSIDDPVAARRTARAAGLPARAGGLRSGQGLRAVHARGRRATSI